VISTFQNHWKLDSNSSVLDVGCSKGFMLFDLARIIPGISIKGVDISEYAINNSKIEVREYLQIADAQSLPFNDNSFDVVISINTVHNLDKIECANALREIERVSRRNSFITVDAYRNDEEKKRMYKWNLTAKTIMHVEEWKSFFDSIGYTGDYFWFIP
jgi:ubiquinone/menaquinone biosynthesis C-methylase UbiE